MLTLEHQFAGKEEGKRDRKCAPNLAHTTLLIMGAARKLAVVHYVFITVRTAANLRVLQERTDYFGQGCCNLGQMPMGCRHGAWRVRGEHKDTDYEAIRKNGVLQMSADENSE